MIRSRADASRAPAAPLRGRFAPPDPPARSQDPAAISDREGTQRAPDNGKHDRITPKPDACGHTRMQVGRISRAATGADYALLSPSVCRYGYGAPPQRRVSVAGRPRPGRATLHELSAPVLTIHDVLHRGMCVSSCG